MKTISRTVLAGLGLILAGTLLLLDSLHLTSWSALAWPLVFGGMRCRVPHHVHPNSEELVGCDTGIHPSGRARAWSEEPHPPGMSDRNHAQGIPPQDPSHAVRQAFPAQLRGATIRAHDSEEPRP
jgi:hypothetical protein